MYGTVAVFELSAVLQCVQFTTKLLYTCVAFRLRRRHLCAVVVHVDCLAAKLIVQMLIHRLVRCHGDFELLGKERFLVKSVRSGLRLCFVLDLLNQVERLCAHIPVRAYPHNGRQDDGDGRFRRSSHWP